MHVQHVGMAVIQVSLWASSCIYAHSAHMHPVGMSIELHAGNIQNCRVWTYAHVASPLTTHNTQGVQSRNTFTSITSLQLNWTHVSVGELRIHRQSPQYPTYRPKSHPPQVVHETITTSLFATVKSLGWYPVISLCLALFDTSPLYWHYAQHFFPLT